MDMKILARVKEIYEVKSFSEFSVAKEDFQVRLL
jgi:hypothetical protein